MLPNLDTYAAALKIDRELVLKRAERRALLLAAVNQSGTAPAGVTVGATAERRGGLARSVRSLRWLLRPAHA